MVNLGITEYFREIRGFDSPLAEGSSWSSH